MASKLKRSYNNITCSMLRLSNCFSQALTHGKIYPDINIRLTNQRNDIGNKGFHLKKKSQQILCVNKNEIMRTEPNNNIKYINSQILLQFLSLFESYSQS